MHVGMFAVVGMAVTDVLYNVWSVVVRPLEEDYEKER